MSKLKLTGPALLITFLVSIPALRDAFINHTLPTSTMLIRVGLAVFFAMIAVAFISSVVDSFRLQNALRHNREEAAATAAELRRLTDEKTVKR